MHDDKRREQMARRYLSARLALFERAYRESGNPVFAWRAHMYCTSSGAPLPEWLQLYLMQALRKLEALSTTAPANGLASAVFDALEIRQRPGPGTLLSQADRDLLLAIEVAWRLADGEQESYAIEAVAKALGEARSTVYRAWKGYESSAADWAQEWSRDG